VCVCVFCEFVCVCLCVFVFARMCSWFVFAPTLTRCKHLRKLDRIAHVASYPQLFYPDAFVMEGGYKAFHELFPVSEEYAPT
jgi:hypothetical protein